MTDEISGYRVKLAVGSTIIRPLEPSQWVPLHGTLKDAFGVIWVVDVVAAYRKPWAWDSGRDVTLYGSL